MSMQCAEFDRRLQRQLDRRLSPQSDRKLARHARHCEACRQMLAAQVLVIEHLALAGRDVPPRGLLARVVADSPQASAAPGRRADMRKAVWKYAAGLAAAVLLAVSSLAGLRIGVVGTPPAQPAAGLERVASERGFGGDIGQRVVTERTGPERSTPDRSVAERRESDIERASLAPLMLVTAEPPAAAPRQRMAVLATETGQSLAAVVLRLPGVRSQSSLGESAGADDNSPWIESVTGGLKPFAESLSDAVAPWLDSAPPAERIPRS